MTLIVYCRINGQTLRSSLGMPEYSYYFVLRGFMPVLRGLGRVVSVNDPEREVDPIYEACRERGESCVYLTFSPPNKAAVGLRCPTICILAWEFDRIPDEAWDDDRKNDWRYVLADHGGAITLSKYSRDAVKKAMGEDFPVLAIPAPVWDGFRAFREAHAVSHRPARIDLALKGNIVDSRNYRITPDSFELKDPLKGFDLNEWNGETVHLGFGEADESSAYLGGFYRPEPWGTWSRTATPWVFLPFRLRGAVRLKVALCAYGANVNRPIFVSLGEDTHVIEIGEAGVEADLCFHLKETSNILKFSGLDLTPVANAADARSMGIGLKSIEIMRLHVPDWNGEKLRLAFTDAAANSSCLGGFYRPEPWGTWSRTEAPWVLLPLKLRGEVHFKLMLCGYGRNHRRKIFVTLGREKKSFRLKRLGKKIDVDFNPASPECVLKFSGLDLSPVPNAVDPRSMGVGLQSIEISGNSCPEPFVDESETVEPLRGVSLEGIVYTSVLNPADGRKNWSDMVKAFGMAFRDTADATLVLKMTHQSLSSFLGKLHFLLQQMWPYRCRIVALHGYLENMEFEKLIAATHFYVNTSRCEGLCLPLMEFMSCGKPVISPGHTSLADYVEASSAFIVESSVEPSVWPGDSRDVFRAFRYRLDWQSLVDAYRRSYGIVKNQPNAYKKMSMAASARMKAYCSNRAVREQLQVFLEKRIEPNRGNCRP